MAGGDRQGGTLAGPKHSGQFGGAAPDALLVLLHALASLHDENGDVAVPGLRREEWTGASYSDDEFRDLAEVVPGRCLSSGPAAWASESGPGPAITVTRRRRTARRRALNAVVPHARAKLGLRDPSGGGPRRGAGGADPASRRAAAVRDRARGRGCPDRLGGVFLRMDPKTELGARVRHDRIESPVDGLCVDAGDGDRQGHRRTARRPGSRPGGPARARQAGSSDPSGGGPRRGGQGSLDLERDPRTAAAFEMPDQRRLASGGVFLRMDPKTGELGAWRHEPALRARSTGCASMPVTVIAGPGPGRSPRPPVPKKGVQARSQPGSRNSSSLLEAPVHFLAAQPRARRRRRSRRAARRAHAAGRARAAHVAELTAVLRAGERAPTRTPAMPRSPMVRVGTPGRRLVSAISIASGREQLGGRFGGNVVNALAISSSLDHELGETGGFPPHARRAPTWTRMFDFESAAPRPKIAPSRSVASRTAGSHFDTSPSGDERRSGRTGARSARLLELGSRRR